MRWVPFAWQIIGLGAAFTIGMWAGSPDKFGATWFVGALIVGVDAALIVLSLLVNLPDRSDR